MKIKTSVKSGGINLNHQQAVAGLKVRSAVKAGGPPLVIQHNQTASLRVRSNVKAGGPILNHNQSAAAITV